MDKQIDLKRKLKNVKKLPWNEDQIKMIKFELQCQLDDQIAKGETNLVVFELTANAILDACFIGEPVPVLNDQFIERFYAQINENFTDIKTLSQLDWEEQY